MLNGEKLFKPACWNHRAVTKHTLRLPNFRFFEFEGGPTSWFQCGFVFPLIFHMGCNPALSQGVTLAVFKTTLISVIYMQRKENCNTEQRWQKRSGIFRTKYFLNVFWMCQPKCPCTKKAFLVEHPLFLSQLSRALSDSSLMEDPARSVHWATYPCHTSLEIRRMNYSLSQHLFIFFNRCSGHHSLVSTGLHLVDELLLCTRGRSALNA